MQGIEFKLPADSGMATCPQCGSTIDKAGIIYEVIKEHRQDATGYRIIDAAKPVKLLAGCNNWHQWAIELKK